MNQQVFLALLRHALTVIAGGAIAKYQIDGATADAIIAGLTGAAGVAWSIWDKRKR